MRLKLATRELHTRAERSGVMAELLARRISRGAYGALLVNLHAIYVALESMLSTSTLDTSTVLPLARAAALASDLRVFAAGATVVPLEAATLAYVEHLHTLDSTRAHCLWAHVYVRYLGDLHGGQILNRLVRELFAVNEGTRFYDFGADDQVRALREGLRTALETSGLDAVQADEVVAEAVWAFDMHCRLFEQIHARCAPEASRMNP
jgi:heme oxygenase (biliverdin-producing, ferredoxin)